MHTSLVEKDGTFQCQFLRAGARPAGPLICAFIDTHRERFGVVPICRALRAHGVQIAPRTYWASCSRPASKRALWDTAVTEVLAGIYEPDERGRGPPECLYGSVKMWEHLNRQGITVAKCTVEVHRGAADAGPPVAGRHPGP